MGSGRRLRMGMYILCLLAVAAPGLQADPRDDASGPTKLELSGAEHRMEKFEDKVRRMHGQPFRLGHSEKEALQRISELHAKYPDHPKVKTLFERARKALLASKGKVVETNAKMAAFRENGKKLQLMFAEEGDKQYETFRAKAAATKDAITKAFPPPDPNKTYVGHVIGRTVILPGFQYPDNEFTFVGSQYCFVGSGAKGYYYVALSNRAWLGAYEALRRYRRELGLQIPQEVAWTIIGKITGLHMLTPQAGKKKSISPRLGWVVEPEAIYVPGHTFAVSEADHELGGTFAAEDKAETIKSSMYTVKSVPENVTPERLVEIFSIAIREKNYKLYVDCIDPERRKTPKALARVWYHWELHQQRFAELYVQIKIEKAKISVLKGLDESGEFERVFLTKEELEKLKKASGPLVEEAEVKSRAYDERGLQYGSPKPHFLKRIEKKRWYITNYPQPF